MGYRRIDLAVGLEIGAMHFDRENAPWLFEPPPVVALGINSIDSDSTYNSILNKENARHLSFRRRKRRSRFRKVICRAVTAKGGAGC
jgi:hypothetical protein